MQSRLRPARSQVDSILLSPDDAMARLNKLFIVDVQNPKYPTSVLPKSHRLNVDTFRTYALRLPVGTGCKGVRVWG